jgi:hypothetical protein
MPKLSDIRRIIPEDFSQDDRELAEKIGGSYNDFADELYQVVNGQLDFDNMARRKVSIDVVFNADGTPRTVVNINSGLANVSMIHVGKVQNITTPSAKFTALPYIDWSHQGNGLIKINYGTGFTAGSKYRLILELVQ